MIYILLGYIALNWIASIIVLLVPIRYKKVLVSLSVIVNPFFFIIALIDIVILEKRRRKVLDKER